MAFARYGIDQIALCTKGTLATTPTKIIPGGLRGKTGLRFKDIGDEDESRGRFLQRGVMITIDEFPIYQPNLLHLKNIIEQYLPDGGCDVELKARPQSSGVDGGCFQFKGASNQHMGIGFKYEMSKKRRALLIRNMLMLSKTAAKTLIDAADSNTPASLNLTAGGIDESFRRIPWLNFTHNTFSYADIEDYSFTLESIKDKENDLEEREISQALKATIMYKFRSATITNMVSEMVESQGVALSFQQDTGASTFEKFSFAQYVLSKQGDRFVHDDERNLTLIYSGIIPIGNISFSFTTQNGGGSTQDGTEGGTVTISN